MRFFTPKFAALTAFTGAATAGYYFQQTALCAPHVDLSENHNGRFWTYYDTYSTTVEQLCLDKYMRKILGAENDKGLLGFDEYRKFYDFLDKVYAPCLIALEAQDIDAFRKEVHALQSTVIAPMANQFLIAICIDTANRAALNVMREFSPKLTDEIKTDRVWGNQVPMPHNRKTTTFAEYQEQNKIRRAEYFAGKTPGM